MLALVASLLVPSLQLVPSTRRECVRSAAAATAAACIGVRFPAVAERNVITKDEAKEQSRTMITKFDKPGEETEESIKNQELRKQKYAATMAKANAFEALVKAIER